MGVNALWHITPWGVPRAWGMGGPLTLGQLPQNPPP